MFFVRIEYCSLKTKTKCERAAESSDRQTEKLPSAGGVAIDSGSAREPGKQTGPASRQNK